MKNKVFKLLSLGLCSILTCAVLGGCGNKSGGKEKENEDFVSKAVISSFESYSDFYNIFTTDALRTEINSDKNFVTDGEKSLKFMKNHTPTGKYGSSNIGIPLVKNEDEALKDFSKALNITYDVFNASNAEVDITTSVMKHTGSSLGGSVTRSGEQKITLAAGEQKAVNYVIDRNMLYFSLGINEPTHINLKIDGVDPTIYVDNMQINYVQESYVAPELTVAEDELCSFEQGFQDFVFAPTGPFAKGELVTDPSGASEGVRYYKVNAVSDDISTLWGQVGFASNYLNKLGVDSVSKTKWLAYDIKITWKGSTSRIATRLIKSAPLRYNNVYANIPHDNKWHTVCLPMTLAPEGIDSINVSLGMQLKGDLCLDNFRFVDTPPVGAIVTTEGTVN